MPTERDKKIIALINSGKSNGAAAKEMNVTRNVVAGVVNRNKHLLDPEARSHRIKKCPPMVKKELRMIKLPDEKEDRPPPPKDDGRLGHDCQWIEGDPRKDEKCGMPVMKRGHPWCAKHHARAYNIK